MVLGQTSATAASHAIDESAAVQKIDYAKLRKRLEADKQVLVWTGPVRRPGGAGVIDPSKLPGVVIDDEAAKFTGSWNPSSANPPFVGAGYRHDANDHKGDLSATFEAKLPAGKYEVRVSYSPNTNRASNVPVTVRFAGGSKTLSIDQKKAAPIDGAWVSLGAYDFAADAPAQVIISNKDTNGHVIVDAVWFVK